MLVQDSSVVEKIEKDKRSIGHKKLNILLNRLGVYSIVILLIILGSIVSDKFFSYSNFMNIISPVALLGIIAVGVSFVTYSGHFADLSVPSIIALSGYIAVDTLRFGIVISITAGIIAGMLVGLINAFVVGKLKANPIIWTLAIAFLMSGLMRWAYGGTQIYPDIRGATRASDIFISLARIRLFDTIPVMVIIMIIVVIIGQFILAKTKFGAQLKLVGSSYDVAAMTGINVPRTVGAAFLISSFTASVAGIFLASLSKVGAYYNGQGYDFSAVTVIVIGGMTLAGGRGSIVGVLGGVITIGLLNNIMTLIGIDTFSQRIITGMIFILVVGINAKSLRKLGRDDA